MSYSEPECSDDVPAENHRSRPVSANTLKNQKKKQRQKLAKKAKLGLLPVMGKLAKEPPPDKKLKGDSEISCLSLNQTQWHCPTCVTELPYPSWYPFLSGQEAAGASAGEASGSVMVNRGPTPREALQEATAQSPSVLPSEKRGGRKRKKKTEGSTDTELESLTPSSGSKRSKAEGRRAREKWHSSEMLLDRRNPSDGLSHGAGVEAGQAPST